MKLPLFRRPRPLTRSRPPFERWPEAVLLGGRRLRRRPVHLETLHHPEHGYLLLGVLLDDDDTALRLEVLHGAAAELGEPAALERASEWLVRRRDALYGDGFAPPAAYPEHLWDAVLTGVGVGAWARVAELRSRPEPGDAVAEPDEKLTSLLRSNRPIELVPLTGYTGVRYSLTWWRHQPAREWRSLCSIGDRIRESGLFGVTMTPELVDHPSETWLLVGSNVGESSMLLDLVGPEHDGLAWSERRLLASELVAAFSRAGSELILPRPAEIGTTARWRRAWAEGKRGMLGVALVHDLAADASQRPWLVESA